MSRRIKYNHTIFTSASIHTPNTASAVYDVSAVDGLSLTGTWKATAAVSGTLKMAVSNDPQKGVAANPTFVSWSNGDVQISGTAGSFAASLTNPNFQFAKWTWEAVGAATGSGAASGSTISVRLAGVCLGA